VPLLSSDIHGVLPLSMRAARNETRPRSALA